MPKAAAASPSEEGGKALDRERRALAVGAALQDQLVRRHMKVPFDFIYERYSLFSAAGIWAARELGIPCFVEVNAPLLLEQRPYRKLALQPTKGEKRNRKR